MVTRRFTLGRNLSGLSMHVKLLPPKLATFISRLECGTISTSEQIACTLCVCTMLLWGIIDMAGLVALPSKVGLVVGYVIYLGIVISRFIRYPAGPRQSAWNGIARASIAAAIRTWPLSLGWALLILTDVDCLWLSMFEIIGGGVYGVCFWRSMQRTEKCA
jgi:hypothetical protein